MAIVAADRYEGTHGVYTFGCPGVGNDEFIDNYPLPSNTFRFVNNNDVVPRVASELFGHNIFGHVGQFIYLDCEGKCHTQVSRLEIFLDRALGSISHLDDSMKGFIQAGRFDQLPLDQLIDHSPIHYCIHIWNNVHSQRSSSV